MNPGGPAADAAASCRAASPGAGRFWHAICTSPPQRCAKPWKQLTGALGAWAATRSLLGRGTSDRAEQREVQILTRRDPQVALPKPVQSGLPCFLPRLLKGVRTLGAAP